MIDDKDLIALLTEFLERTRDIEVRPRPSPDDDSAICKLLDDCYKLRATILTRLEHSRYYLNLLRKWEPRK